MASFITEFHIPFFSCPTAFKICGKIETDELMAAYVHKSESGAALASHLAPSDRRIKSRATIAIPSVAGIVSIENPPVKRQKERRGAAGSFLQTAKKLGVTPTINEGVFSPRESASRH